MKVETEMSQLIMGNDSRGSSRLQSKEQWGREVQNYKVEGYEGFCPQVYNLGRGESWNLF